MKHRWSVSPPPRPAAPASGKPSLISASAALFHDSERALPRILLGRRPLPRRRLGLAQLPAPHPPPGPNAEQALTTKTTASRDSRPGACLGGGGLCRSHRNRFREDPLKTRVASGPTTQNHPDGAELGLTEVPAADAEESAYSIRRFHGRRGEGVSLQGRAASAQAALSWFLTCLLTRGRWWVCGEKHV